MKTCFFLFFFISFKLSNCQTVSTDSMSAVYNYIFGIDKKVYLIGENNHEEKETQKLKSDILINAFKNNKADILVWEADFAECYIRGKTLNGDSNNTTIKSIFNIWHSDFTRNLFKKLSFYKLRFLGMDIRPAGHMFTDWVSNELKSQNYSRVDEFVKTDNETIKNGLKMKLIDSNEMNRLKNYYDDIFNQIKSNKDHYDPLDFLFIERSFYCRKKLVEFLSKEYHNKFYFRDTCMAENVNWIDSVFNQKMIIWAHNYHNSYDKDERLFLDYNSPHSSMGGLLNPEIRKNALNVAISAPAIMGIRLKKDFLDNTFEYKNMGEKFYSIIDLRTINTGPIPNLTSETRNKTNLSNEYDLLVIIRDSYK